jgi:hypothetical protein
MHYENAITQTGDQTYDLSKPVQQAVLEHGASKHSTDVEEMDLNEQTTTPIPNFSEIFGYPIADDLASQLLEQLRMCDADAASGESRRELADVELEQFRSSDTAAAHGGPQVETEAWGDAYAERATQESVSRGLQVRTEAWGDAYVERCAAAAAQARLRESSRWSTTGRD